MCAVTLCTIVRGVKGLRGVKGHFSKKFFEVLKLLKYQLAKVWLTFQGWILDCLIVLYVEKPQIFIYMQNKGRIKEAIF